MPRSKQSPITTFPEAARLLSEKLRAQTLRGNIHTYQPQEQQLPFHKSIAKGRLVLGGNRSGKTYSGIAEDVYWAKGQHPYRPVPPAPTRGRIVSVDFLNGIEKIIRPELARCMPTSDLKGGSWETAYSRELRTLTLENESTIEFMSYDQDLDKFAGTSRHWIHFDEEPPREIFIENKARLIDTGGSYWITMTPVEGMTWLYDELYLPGKRGEDNIKVIEMDMLQNPYLQEGEIQIFMQGLDSEEKAARLHGKFIQIGGLIYKTFDPEVHCIPFEKAKEILDSKTTNWMVACSLDHGYSNQTAWLWHMTSQEGRVVTFYELCDSEKTVDFYAEQVHNINRELGITPEYYTGDPSICQHNGITGTSVQEEYMKYDIPIVPSNNDVMAGLGRVNRYLKPVLTASGQTPMLLITQNCTTLVKQMQRLRYKTYATKKTQSENNRHEVQHKKDDHAPDSLRYFIMSRPDLSPSVVPPNPMSNPLGIKEVNPGQRLAVIRRPDVNQDWNTEALDEVMGGQW